MINTHDSIQFTVMRKQKKNYEVTLIPSHPTLTSRMGETNVLRHSFFRKYLSGKIMHDPDFLSEDIEFNSLQTSISFALKR
jgi:hypothetical protein